LTDEFSGQGPPPYIDGSLGDKTFQSSNTYLKQFFQRPNATYPSMEIPTRNFYSHINLMTSRWIQSLSQRMFK
jgi:hypothetical protein